LIASRNVKPEQEGFGQGPASRDGGVSSRFAAMPVCRGACVLACPVVADTTPSTTVHQKTMDSELRRRETGWRGAPASISSPTPGPCAVPRLTQRVCRAKAELFSCLAAGHQSSPPTRLALRPVTLHSISPVLAQLRLIVEASPLYVPTISALIFSALYDCRAPLPTLNPLQTDFDECMELPAYDWGLDPRTPTMRAWTDAAGLPVT
jgi:hypothetical protein